MRLSEVRLLSDFAFNIPENQFREAKAWLASRVEIARPNGSDEIFYDDWNAHAVYFPDPGGNLVEFIARHNLPDRSEREFNGIPRNLVFQCAHQWNR